MVFFVFRSIAVIKMQTTETKAMMMVKVTDYWYNLDENEADHNPDEEFKGEGFESWCEEVIVAKRDGIIVSPRAQVEGELTYGRQGS